MAEPFRQFLSTGGDEPAAHMVATTARWLGFTDDLAFGCECADPALQIEYWREEAALLPANSS